MPSEVITIVIELMFLGVNMVLALLRTHFNNQPESDQKHIYAQEHQSSMDSRDEWSLRYYHSPLTSLVGQCKN